MSNCSCRHCTGFQTAVTPSKLVTPFAGPHRIRWATRHSVSLEVTGKRPQSELNSYVCWRIIHFTYGIFFIIWNLFAQLCKQESLPGMSIWDLWSMKLRRDRYFTQTFQYHSTAALDGNRGLSTGTPYSFRSYPRVQSSRLYIIDGPWKWEVGTLCRVLISLNIFLSC